LLQIQNWKTAVRNKEGWVGEIGEAMDRKRAKSAIDEAKKNNDMLKQKHRLGSSLK